MAREASCAVSATIQHAVEGKETWIGTTLHSAEPLLPVRGFLDGLDGRHQLFVHLNFVYIRAVIPGELAVFLAK